MRFLSAFLVFFFLFALSLLVATPASASPAVSVSVHVNAPSQFSRSFDRVASGAALNDAEEEEENESEYEVDGARSTRPAAPAPRGILGKAVALKDWVFRKATLPARASRAYSKCVEMLKSNNQFVRDWDAGRINCETRDNDEADMQAYMQHRKNTFNLMVCLQDFFRAAKDLDPNAPVPGGDLRELEDKTNNPNCRSSY